MKLVQRANGMWYLEYIDLHGSRKRVTTGTSDKNEASQRAWRMLLQEAGGQGQGQPVNGGGGVTLKAALDHTYNRVWKEHKSEHTFRSLMRTLSGQYGDVRIMDIDYPMLTRWVERWEDEGKANATINRRMACLSKCLGEAAKMGWITGVPPFPRKTERASKFRWLTNAEELRLLDACSILGGGHHPHHMRALITFLVDTGARLSEALRLTEADVGKGQVTFHDTKNGGTRTVPLTQRAEVAAGWLVHQDLTPDQAHHRFVRVREKAGLPDVGLHTLRHTCASRLVQGGMDIYRVQKWLGHSSVTVTERYSHLAPSHLVQGTDILSRASDLPALRVVK